MFEVPAAGLSFGEQLAFYSAGGRTRVDLTPPPHRASTPLPVSHQRNTRPENGTYGPLGAYLDGLDAREAVLTFSDIERILGRPLPASARRYQAWWANEKSGTHSHAKSWMVAGWETRNVDLNAARVRFVRAGRR
jgi:hypothetical protein